MYDENTDPLLVSRCEWAARFCALAVATLGIAVLIGWMLDIAVLKSVLPELVTMKANTALGFVLAGGSLFAANWSKTAAVWRRAQFVLGALVVLIGLLTLGEYALAVDLGIDQLLFQAPVEPISMTPSGRMAVATAAGFSFTGLALLLLDCRRGRIGAQVAALIGNLIGVLALLGYAYNVTTLYGIGAYSGVALHTAAGFVVINLGVLLARPQRGLMAVVTSKTAGGFMARRLLPFALLAPFIIGWLRVQGEQRGLYPSEFGVALVALVYVILFSVFIWRTAEALRHSDQKRFAAERARRQQQAQLTGIIDSAMDAIIMVDAAQRIVLFNPAAAQMFGHHAADVLDGPLEVLLPERFRATHFGHLQSFASTGATSRRMGGLGAITGLRANGEEFPIEASISQLETDGEQYFTVILRDVTESQRVQDALRASKAFKLAILNSLTAEIAVVDRNGVIQTINEPWRRFALENGINSDETVPSIEIGANYLAACEAAEGSASPEALAARDGIRAVLDGNLSTFSMEYPCHSPQQQRWFRMGVTPLEHSKQGGAVISHTDITIHEQTKAELISARKAAEDANCAKSRFLAAASHDLRQPLSALSLYVDALKHKIAPADRPLVANMKDCIGSLSSLLTDLLDLSKLEAGVVRPNVSDFPVAATLASLESIHTPEAQVKGLQLRCLSSDLTIRTDPILFQRLLGNLIDNAIRYTERGGVIVACRRRYGRSWLEVRDTGIGIPADKTVEIFEEFKQLNGDARNRGSGLGLAIVAKTATLLGLEIRVNSRPGRGSLFAIELPLGQQLQTKPALAVSDEVSRSLRIGLVEDNAMVRQALTIALQGAGHQLVVAATGAELLAELGHLAPDVVISDYRLAHGETGFDVINGVRARLGADLPAILITGDTDPTLIRSMTNRGIVVVHKPLEMNVLQAYLDNLTRQAS